MEGVPVTLPAVIHVEVPKMEVPTGIAGKARGVMDSVTNSFNAWKQKVVEVLPKNFSIWLIAITCLIVLVAVSRILTLQKSVTELQSRPVVDENVIRVAVRKHLEETVKAMEQHNKAQAMARQSADEARIAELQRVAAEQNRQLELQRLELKKAEEQQAKVEEPPVPKVETVVPKVETQAAAEVKSEAKADDSESKAGSVREELDEEEKPVEKKKKSKSSQ